MLVKERDWVFGGDGLRVGRITGVTGELGMGKGNRQCRWSVDRILTPVSRLVERQFPGEIGHPARLSANAPGLVSIPGACSPVCLPVVEQHHSGAGARPNWAHHTVVAVLDACPNAASILRLIGQGSPLLDLWRQRLGEPSSSQGLAESNAPGSPLTASHSWLLLGQHVAASTRHVVLHAKRGFARPPPRALGFQCIS